MNFLDENDFETTRGLFGRNERVAEINMRAIQRLTSNQITPEEVALIFGDYVSEEVLWMFTSLQLEQREFMNVFNPCPVHILPPAHLIVGNH